MAASLPLLGEADLRPLISTETALELVEAAYRDYGRVRSVLSRPESMGLAPPGSGFSYKLKGGYAPSQNASGFRLVGIGPDSLVSHCLVLDEAGRPLGLVDESWLHRLRTAVSSAVAARWLARPDARSLAIVGAGQIAMEIPAAFKARFPIEDIRIASRSAGGAQALAEIAGRHARTRVASSVAEAVAGAEIVVTVTSASSPVLFARDIAPGATIIGLGGGAEIAVDVLDAAQRLVVDDLEFASVMGSLAGWVAAGRERSAIEARIAADIGEVAIGARHGRTHSKETVLAIIQGMASCDVALAAYALSRWSAPS